MRFVVPGERLPPWTAVVLAAIGVTGFAWSGGHLIGGAMPSTDRGVALGVPGAAATPGAATPSSATPSAATPSSATPSAATPSSATPSSATPSAATPSDCPPLFSVRFGRTSSDAIDLEAPAIAALVAWLRAHPDSALVIQGHADAVGNARFNFALSHRRAQTVARRFADAGLPKRRMVVQAVGEFQPRVDGDLADNRRVVLRATRAEGCRGAFTPEDDR